MFVSNVGTIRRWLGQSLLDVPNSVHNKQISCSNNGLDLNDQPARRFHNYLRMDAVQGRLFPTSVNSNHLPLQAQGCTTCVQPALRADGCLNPVRRMAWPWSMTPCEKIRARARSMFYCFDVRPEVQYRAQT